jgi:hypothetical protein
MRDSPISVGRARPRRQSRLSVRAERILGSGALALALLANGGCDEKPLVSSPCGSVSSASEVQPGVLSVSGSFTVTGSDQLVLVLTTAPFATRLYPSSAMTSITALVPLTSLPLIPHGTYAAVWIMDGCETPDQTQILGPDSVTVTG